MSALFTLYSTMSCKNLAYCWKMAEMLVEVCQRKEHPPRRRTQRTRPEGKAENQSEDIIFATLYLTKLPNDQLILDMGKGSVKGEIPNSLHPQWVSQPPRFNGSHDELLWHLPLYKSQALFLTSHHFRFSPRCQFIASTCHALQQIKPPINSGNRRLCPGQNLPRTLSAPSIGH